MSEIEQNDIHRLELIALLHDLAKLTDEFIAYRQNWRADETLKDPHEKHKTILRKEFKSVMEVFEKKKCHGLTVFNVIDNHTKKSRQTVYQLQCHLTVFNVIDNHTKGGNSFLNTIKSADALDAAYDRNNPLSSSEQSGDITVYKSTVFGYETPLVDGDGQIECIENHGTGECVLTKHGSLDDALVKLYTNLENKLLKRYWENPTFDDREKIFAFIREAFEKGLSDTTRPANDTTLWDHCYAVASIAKAQYSANVKYEKNLPKNFSDVNFRILGYCWNGTGFLAGAQKIADVGGRKKALDDLKRDLQKKIEFELQLGNCVYQDLDGIYFLVPEGAEDLEEFSKYGHETALNATNGDIWPDCHISGPTQNMTDLTKVISELRKFKDIPFSGDISSLVDEYSQSHNENRFSVCPLCKKRKEEKEKKEGKEKKVCTVCLKRRKDNAKIALEKNQTPYFSEIARGNKSGKKRLALVMVKFDLDPWLDGSMIRTMFVSPLAAMDQEIKELGGTDYFLKAKKERKNELQDAGIDTENSDMQYEDVLSDLDSILKENGTSLRAFLYGRGRNWGDGTLTKTGDSSWSSLVESEPETEKSKRLAWELCTKTPTPSTLLDTWHTTEKFIQDCFYPKKIPKDIFPFALRRYFNAQELKFRLDIIDGAVYEAVVQENSQGKLNPGDKFRFVVFGDKGYVLDDLNPENSSVEYYLEDDDASKKEDSIGKTSSMSFRPMREIASSASLGYIILPADSIPDYIKHLHNEYQKHYGKVASRLQMFVGALFFDKFIPMNVVFNAASKMLHNFNKTNYRKIKGTVEEIDQEKLNIKLGSVPFENSNLDLDIRSTLGNCKIDSFHPYILLSEEKQFCKTYFETKKWPVCSPNESLDKKVILRPNIFDFEYLESSARRHDIWSNKSTRLTGPLGFSLHPYLLSTFIKEADRIWNVLKKHDASERQNFETLLHLKIQQWKSAGDFKEFIPDFMKVVSDNFFPEFKDDFPDPRLLMDVLDLFDHIIKRKPAQEL